MNEDKKWMLMTYYCPTHGDIGRIEPFDLKRKEINKTLLKKVETQKKLNQ